MNTKALVMKMIKPFNGKTLRIYLAALAAVGTFAIVNGLAVKMFDQGVEIKGDSNTVTVVAREPGTPYDVLKFCSDPDTRVTLGTPMEVKGTHYVLARGQETIDWKDTDPSLSNPNAMRYWITPEGKQSGEPVEITKPAAECIRKKLK